MLSRQNRSLSRIFIAEADAKQKVIAANAEAEAILAEAQAQADANKLIEDSLSEKVIAYEQIQKWNGVMPKGTGSDRNGLLSDVNIDDPSSASSQSTDTANNEAEKSSAEIWGTSDLDDNSG